MKRMRAVVLLCCLSAFAAAQEGILIHPQQFEMNLREDESAIDSMTIINQNLDDFTYAIRCEESSVLAQLRQENEEYHWRSSLDPGGPIFQWIDISSSGTNLEVWGDDQVFGPFDLGFSFSFYGDSYDQFYVSTNGFISFLEPWGSTFSSFIPDPNDPNAQTCIMGDDLCSGYVLFASDDQKAVISFYDFYLYGTFDETNYTFQIILYRSGHIIYQYLEIQEPYEYFAYPVIGIENAAGDDGIMIDPYELYPADALAIEFYRGASWLTLLETSGTVLANDSTQVLLTFDATDIPGGAYKADLFISDAQTGQDVASVPVLLSVTAQPDIAIDLSSLNFGLVYHSFTKSLPVVVRNFGSADLEISSITSSSSSFFSDVASLSVAPYDTAAFLVTFAPTATGEHSAILQLVCNDWDEPVNAVQLSGVSTLSPDIDLEPTSFSVALDEGAADTMMLTLKNESQGVLNYALLFRSQTGESLPLTIAQVLRNNRRAGYRNKQIATQNDDSQMTSSSAQKRLLARLDRRVDIWQKYNNSCFSADEPIRIVVVQGPGTDDYSVTEVWDQLNQNWRSYGATPIIIDYSTLNKDDISLADIMNSGADVVVLSDVKNSWWYENYALTASECQAIIEYVNSGNGLYCSGETLNNSSGQEMQVHVDYFAPLLGLDPTLQYDYWYAYESGEMVQTDLNHPLWRNFYAPYHFASYQNVLVPLTGNSDWHEAVIDAEIHAISVDNHLVVTGLGNRLSISVLPEMDYYDDMSEENYQFLYNAMTFAATGGLAWCTTENRMDSLMGNSEVSVPLVFDATSLDQGEYVGVLVVKSNDPDEEEIEVDLSLRITDTQAPAAISDLRADYIAPTFITFSWTTPGDNGMTGRADRFEVRYSSEPLDESTWALATTVCDSVPAALTPGTTQHMILRNLQPQSQYYIALKTVDEVNNTAAISNVISVQTPASIDAIVYIPFEEGGGDRVKNSGQGGCQHDGILYNFQDLSGLDAMENSGWTEQGWEGRGLILDGLNDFVEIADYNGSPLLLNSALKIGFAFKPAEAFHATGQMNLEYILEKSESNHGYYIAMNRENGKMRFVIRFSYDRLEIFETARASWEADTWYNIMITYDYNALGDNVKLYVNGRLDAFYTTESVLPTSRANFRLGGYYSYDGFEITLDNLLVHNTLVPAASEFTAYFKANPKICTIGDVVQFTDRSTGEISSWEWDFGDSTLSLQQNPQHCYAAADTFTVSLTVKGATGQDTKVFEDMIFVFEPLQALFTADTTLGELPLTVKFNDKSVGFITAWEWDFGDGAISSEQNPTHEYKIKSDYTVTLTVYGLSGAHSSVEQEFIHADVDQYSDAIPKDYVLHQNYPNPFNPTTTIRYGVPRLSLVEIDIVDMNGRCIETLFKGEQTAGYHSITWNAEAKPSNIYFIRMKTGEDVKTVKCVLLK